MKNRNLKSRRDFLRLGCRTISTIGAAAAFGEAGLLTAQTTAADYKALVCIFLFGGNDANNMLIPNDTATYKQYQTVRGNLAISQASLVGIHDPLSGAGLGLHPSLAGIGKLYNDPANPRLALLANTGTLVQPIGHDGSGKPILTGNGVVLPLNLFSHSDQVNEWQNAVPQGGPDASTGWEGRLADKIVQLNTNPAIPPSIGISGGALQLVGFNTKPSTVATKGFAPLTGLKDPRTAALTQMLSFPSGMALVQAAQSSFQSAFDVANAIDAAINAAGPLTTVFPNTSLGQQLAQVAQIIQIRTALGATRQIFFCSLGGFDTHSDQLPQQTSLFTDLSNSMVAFDTALGPLSSSVTTFTESDFSRTFQPNGNAGTDHAWGAHTLIMGGGVKGGNVFGKFPTQVLQGPDDSGDRGNWVPTTSADQYGGALAKWFGVTASSDLDYVFPNLKTFGYQTPAFFG